MADGEVYNFTGNTAKKFERSAARDKLYKTMSQGLATDDLVLENKSAFGGLVAVRSSGVQAEERVGMQSFAESAIAAMSDRRGFWKTHTAQVLLDAIVDSGASYTFVTDSVMLSKPVPGVGKVWVANGQSEPIAQVGKLGPLTARKVRSFDRTLVSVRDLVDKYGGVYFDSSGVHLVSLVGNKFVTSTIGAPTQARLYSFDLKGLLNHDNKVKTEDASVENMKIYSMLNGCSVRSDAEGARGRLSGSDHILTVSQGVLPWCVRVSGMSASYDVSSGSGG